jgi:hypothetical protein
MKSESGSVVTTGPQRSAAAPVGARDLAALPKNSFRMGRTFLNFLRLHDFGAE